jgi:hypothetical protein
MSYVVYVNHPTNKAMVHNINCGKYAARRREKTPNGYWCGPFNDYKKALEFAQTTQKKTIASCAFCCKGIYEFGEF